MVFNETPPPSKTSPLVDDDLDEEEAIKVTEKKNLENDIVDETLEIDKIVNIKESMNHPLENVIGNLNQRTLRSQAKNQSNFFCFISTIEPKHVNEALGDKSWIVTMQEEINQFIANDILELVRQPKNMKIIGTKWVFRNKLDENDVVSRNKASVCLCARFQEAPKTSHLEAVKRIFRYIKGTTHLGLRYPKRTGIETVVYADSDHAGDYVDRKSTSSILIMESLVKKKKKGVILELKRRHLKNIIFCTYTPYPAMKIRCTSANSAQETPNDQFPIRRMMEYCEDEDDCFTNFESEFPAIILDNTIMSREALSWEPTVSPLNDNEFDFRISFDESDDEDYTVIYDENSFSFKIISANDLKTDSENDNEKVNMPSFSLPESEVSYFNDLDFFKDFENEFPTIVYNDALTSKSDFLTEPIVSPQHIDEFNLKDETSLSECNEEGQNVLYINNLFPFNLIYPDDLKSDTDNDNGEIDIEQPSGDMSIIPLPNVINVDDGAYAHGSNKLLKTSHDTSNKVFKIETFIKNLNVNIMTCNHLSKGMSFIFLIKILYVTFGILFDLIMESLVKKKQKGAILELKRRHLKNTIFCTYTPYPAMKIRRISASSAQETRNDQFPIRRIHYNQYAVCTAVHQSKIRI
ncbi:hypothetical protein Tco_1194165 [Tanacetum coccineum]